MNKEFYIDNSVNVGQCIYCKSTEDLTDEHAMPFSMQGDLLLLKASCLDCNGLTTKFERLIARNLFGPIRTALNFQTRNPKKRLKKYKIIIRRNGKLTPIDVPVEENPPPLFLPIFSLPTIIEFPSPSEYGFLGWNVYLLGNAVKEILDKYKTEQFNFIIPEKKYAIAFARFLAKVAYCHAVAAYGLGAINNFFVLPGIRNESEDILKYVGVAEQQGFSRFDELTQPNIIMRSGIKFSESSIFAQIKIFTIKNSPPYIVFVGSLHDETLKSLRAKNLENSWFHRDYKLNTLSLSTLHYRDSFFLPASKLKSDA